MWLTFIYLDSKWDTYVFTLIIKFMFYIKQYQPKIKYIINNSILSIYKTVMSITWEYTDYRPDHILICELSTDFKIF